MKTDPFDDAIRRKLEGVNPPFQEKNWTQFQRFMGSQGFPPSLWQTPARWLQPALLAAAVTGMVITTIWQYRTTQSLTEHVQTLTKTVERMEQVQVRLQQSMTAMAGNPTRVDTVYVKLPVTLGPLGTPEAAGYAAAVQSAAEQPAGLALSNRETARPIPRQGQQTDRYVPSETTIRAARQATSNQQLASRSTTQTNPTVGGQPESSPEQLAGNSSDQATNPDRVASVRLNATANPVSANQPFYAANPLGSAPVPPTSTRKLGRTGTLPSDKQSTANQLSQNSTSSSGSNGPTLYSSSVPNQVSSEITPVANPTSMATGPLATVQPLTPLAQPEQADAFAESWQRHLRRVRYRSPYMTSLGTTATAAAPTQHTTPLPVTFRIGLGGEVGTAQSAAGVYAEAIIANRLTIGTGISQATWHGDEFTTEKQFTDVTKRDFKRDYPGSAPKVPIGPGRPHEVMNISRTAQSIVVPVQIGYRFNMSRQFVLTPTIGLNLSVTPKESVNFDYDRPMEREEVVHNASVRRPTAWYSTLTVGVGAERKWGHFVGQLSPVALLPVRASTASLNELSVGLRGRLFYQF